MKKAVVFILILAFALGLSACGGTGSAADGTDQAAAESVTFKINLAQTTDAPQYDLLLEYLAPTVEERTDGRIKFEVYGSCQLSGGNQIKGFEMAQKGTIDFCLHSGIVCSNIYQDLTAIAIPFLWSGYDNVHAALTEGSDVYSIIEKRLAEDYNLVLLGFTDLGYRQLTNDVRPVSTPEDIKGLKLRVLSNDMLNSVFSNWGCNVVYMDAGEIYTALQQGTIDGQENPMSHNIPYKMYEVQDYYTVWDYVYDPLLIMCNADVWDSIAEADQQIIRDTVKEYIQKSNDLVIEEEETGLEFLEDYGVEITVLTDEQKQVFADSTVETVAPYIEGFDQELVDALYAAAGKTR